MFYIFFCLSLDLFLSFRFLVSVDTGQTETIPLLIPLPDILKSNCHVGWSSSLPDVPFESVGNVDISIWRRSLRITVSIRKLGPYDSIHFEAILEKSLVENTRLILTRC